MRKLIVCLLCYSFVGDVDGKEGRKGEGGGYESIQATDRWAVIIPGCMLPESLCGIHT